MLSLSIAFFWGGRNCQREGITVNSIKRTFSWNMQSIREEGLLDLRMIRSHDLREYLFWPEQSSRILGIISISKSEFENPSLDFCLSISKVLSRFCAKKFRLSISPVSSCLGFKTLNLSDCTLAESLKFEILSIDIGFCLSKIIIVGSWDESRIFVWEFFCTLGFKFGKEIGFLGFLNFEGKVLGLILGICFDLGNFEKSCSVGF